MSTEVQYGSVRLSFVKTQSLECKPVRDPSGADQIYNEFTYTCAATIVRGDFPAVAGESPQETYIRVRHMLTQPRQSLKVTSNGTDILVSNGLDSANGPWPLDGLTVTQITDEAFAVVWGVKVCLPDCNARGLPQPPILSLRWVQTHEVDDRNFSTFVTTGRLIGASDILRNVPLDAFRPMCIPDQPPNTRRHAKYTLQADGLAIDFTFTDTEQYLMPDGQFQERPDGPPQWVAGDLAKAQGKVSGVYEKIILEGIARVARVALRIEAKKTTPKRKLMAMAAGMALSRLKAGRPPGGRMFIKEGAFREHLGDSVVEIHLTALVADVGATAGGGQAHDAGEGTFNAILNALTFGGWSLVQPTVAGAQQAGKGPPKADQVPVKPQIGIGLDAFGVRLDGCADPVDETLGIAPDLRGNYDRLLLMAASLKDPCLVRQLQPVDNLAMEAHLKTPGVSILRTPDMKPADGRTQEPVLKTTPRTDIPPQDLQSYSYSVQSAARLPDAISFNLTGYSDPFTGIYTEYQVLLAFDADQGGRDVLPATVQGEPGREIRTHNDHITLTAGWTATKVGSSPTIPDPEPPAQPGTTTEARKPNAVCTRRTVQPELVEVGADGVTLTHTVTGVYVYAFKDPKKVQMHFPLPPWVASLKTADLPGCATDRTLVFGDQPSTSTLTSR